ncbi:MAG: hypothetical protein M3440_07550 [Chloroflexota bacterium]|nr:hypothetical protein [Chloroflexota bacterium]
MASPALTPSRPMAGVDTTVDLAAWAAHYDQLHVDLGTGDGRFAVQLARTRPELGAIGIDTCLDHPHGSPRRHPPNVRFARLDARDVSIGEEVRAKSVSINFPYGSLLRGLVEGDPALADRIDQLLAPDARLSIRVNERALLDALLDPGGAERAIVRGLHGLGGLTVSVRPITQAELRAFPSTWSKRLGFGRPTAAFLIEAVRHST